ncbi:MAG TPA: hypothetical protein PLT76_09040 [Candidatus Omnitrophota bacterium]|nr:hypothetical protein [Candidatus Omnitrophota bacterium]HPB68946.1 hypothetical protein [Candidatus Omnitrophota bacterium]HQO58847.1 hypothetical protein [Candidatus Omnitrophota bacterium]
MRQWKKTFCVLGSLVVLYAWGTFLPVCSGGDLVLGLASNTYYDIYLGGASDSGTVIKSVQIVDIRQYEGLIFLVVRPDSFSLGQSEGLILLENVKAILPTLKFKTSSIKDGIHYRK